MAILSDECSKVLSYKLHLASLIPASEDICYSLMSTCTGEQMAGKLTAVISKRESNNQLCVALR